MEFFTIGVFNSTKQEFFGKLEKQKIDTFCDIRRRRSVRGPNYLFANKTMLQEILKEAGIKYTHTVKLAPPEETRKLQKLEDQKKHELNTDRKVMGRSFKISYQKNVLDVFDFDTFIKELKKNRALKIVFFCVEKQPEACHRSLVAERLRERYGFKVKDL